MKKLNSAWLPYAGAAVQAGLFGMAGSRYFGAYGWLVGLGVGAVVNASLAVASSRVSEIAQKRHRLAYLAMGGLFCLSPVVITLSLFAPANIATAIAWASAVDLAIVLAGAIAGKSLVTVSATAENLPKGESKKPRKRRQVARKRMTDDALMAFLASNPGATHQQVADAFGVSRQAVGPRVRKLYAVDISQKGSGS